MLFLSDNITCCNLFVLKFYNLTTLILHFVRQTSKIFDRNYVSFLRHFRLLGFSLNRKVHQTIYRSLKIFNQFRLFVRQRGLNDTVSGSIGNGFIFFRLLLILLLPLITAATVFYVEIFNNELASFFVFPDLGCTLLGLECLLYLFAASRVDYVFVLLERVLGDREIGFWWFIGLGGWWWCLHVIKSNRLRDEVILVASTYRNILNEQFFQSI